MAETRAVRLNGINDGAIDPDKNLITFSLVPAGGQAIQLFASSDVVEQITMALGTLTRAIRDARRQPGDPQHAVPLARYGIQQEAFGDAVLVRFEDSNGVPYTFAIPKGRAADIANRLKTESERTDRPGNA